MPFLGKFRKKKKSTQTKSTTQTKPTTQRVQREPTIEELRIRALKKKKREDARESQMRESKILEITQDLLDWLMIERNKIRQDLAEEGQIEINVTKINWFRGLYSLTEQESMELKKITKKNEPQINKILNAKNLTFSIFARTRGEEHPKRYYYLNIKLIELPTRK